MASINSCESESFPVPSSEMSPNSSSGRSFEVIEPKSSNKNLELGSLCKGTAWFMVGVGIPIIYSVGSLRALTYAGIKAFSEIPSSPLDHARLLGKVALGASALPPAAFVSICLINQFMEYCMDNAHGHLSKSSLYIPK